MPIFSCLFVLAAAAVLGSCYYVGSGDELLPRCKPEEECPKGPPGSATAGGAGVAGAAGDAAAGSAGGAGALGMGGAAGEASAPGT